ncbi:TolC family protein [Enhygromyxa salina]|uniref:Outer membrane efflux protein n=1 Tax=Enhygromyxa salina TaxID=215803 RepID=A0A2S9YQH1_9BACT|nr:TolC family protein [Enhygromyxa salina]PRQ07309.1 Outer membrane efflux protein [Enhygromyxa salina]
MRSRRERVPAPGRPRVALTCLTVVLLTATTVRAAPPPSPADPVADPIAEPAAVGPVVEGPSAPPPVLDGPPPASKQLPEPRTGHAPPLVFSGAPGSQGGLLGTDDPVRALFEMPPSTRDDAYGPRPAGIPSLSREQIVRYGLDNPYVKAADQNIEAMRALLRMAKFAWVPIVRTSAVLTPGAAIECDDVSLQGENGQPFSYQYCRAAGDPATGLGRDGGDPADLQTVGGYFDRIAQAGIALRLSAEFVVPITTFGKILSAKKLATQGVEIARLQHLATEQETLLRIYEAHAALLLARESVGILDEAWGIIGAERVKIETELGIGPDGEPAFDADPESLNLDRDPDDLTRLEVGEIELAGRMREARMIEAKALASLWAIAGSAAPRGFDVAEQRLAPDTIEGGLAELDHYRTLALKNRPEAKLADAGVEARKVQEKLARTNFLPDLGAVVRLGYGYANKATPEMRTLNYTGRLNYSNVYFGLAMSWNLDFHNNAFALQRARAQRREAEYQREAAQRLLALEVEDAYRGVIDAEQQLRFAELARDKSWRLVISEQTSGTIGASNFEDLRKALTKWAEFEFQRFEAVMKRNVALARLSRAVGVPLTSH